MRVNETLNNGVVQKSRLIEKNEKNDKLMFEGIFMTASCGLKRLLVTGYGT